VDYILGADTHERIREPLQGKYCKVTEPGAFASFIGKPDLLVENGAIKEETYALLDVDPERYPEDEEMKTLVAVAREPYRQAIGKVIGQTRTPLLRYYVIETPMDNLITDALMWKFNTDFVVSNGFRFCPPLVPSAGGEADITIEYLWSMLPVESAIKTGVVSGQQIVDWLESELDNVFAKEAARPTGSGDLAFHRPRQPSIRSLDFRDVQCFSPWRLWAWSSRIRGSSIRLRLPGSPASQRCWSSGSQSGARSRPASGD